MIYEITCCPESLYDVVKEEGNIIQIFYKNIEWMELIMLWDKIKKKPKGVLQGKEQSCSHKLMEHLGVFSWDIMTSEALLKS